MVTKDMIINDVLRQVPGAMQVFIDSGIPCVGWGAAVYETIEQGARAHRIDPDKLVEKINQVSVKK